MSDPNYLAGSAFRGRLYGFFLGLSGIKRHFRRKLFAGAYPGQPDPMPRRMLDRYAVQQDLLDGRRVWRISLPEQPRRQTVLYLHGGAYVANIQSIHWHLIDELIQRTGSSFIVPDYPLAPTASCQETYRFTAALYSQIIQQTSPEDLVIMGDSAGGGLALGFSQQLRDQGAPQPNQLILLSPWLDVTMSNPRIEEVQGRDRMLDGEALIAAGAAYAGDLDPRDPRVSPLFGSLRDLPQISLFIGTSEVLLPDARKLKQIMEGQGLPLNYCEYPHMFHVWVTIPGLPEGRQAVQQISELLKGPDRAG